MKVALNTDGLYTTQAGTARYIRGLVTGLRKLASPGLEFFELAWPVENFGYGQPERWLKTFYRELVWARFLAPPRLLKNGADLLHSTAGCFIDPPNSIRNVVTLHDLAIERFPDRFRKWQRWSGRRRLRKIDKADRVICISRFTADEAMKCLGLPASKLEVVYNGCDFHPSEQTPVEKTPDFEVPPEFFLFVGSLEPGKNLALLRESWRLAESQGQPLPPLLIVGARWEGGVREGQSPKNWRYLGRQPDDVLVHLYRRTLALVFPSKYEGFGLPVIEAMALGAPVICSPVASLPEVGADAFLSVALDAASYREAMGRLCRDETLRADLARRGRIQANQFSWEKCARHTVQVYEQALR